MGNVIQIKRSTTNTVPVSVTGANSATTGELVYSYRSADGSGDESGDGKLYIGHADGLGSGRSANVIGGSVFMDMLDHTAGTATQNSAVILDNNYHIDAVKTAALHIGSSGSETQVTSTAAELNYVDVTAAGTAQASKAVILDSNAHTSAVKTTTLSLGASGSAVAVTATAPEINKLAGLGSTQAQLEYINVTPGTATASKAVVLNTDSHIDAVKTAALSIGASGSETLVTATAAELNILAGVTADTNDLNLLDGVTASTIELNYVDVTPGTATAEKAVVLDTNSHIDTMKMTNLYIGASGSATQVTSSATELNLLDGITAIDTDLSTVAGTHTTLASALATKTYVDNTRSGLEVKDSSVVATTANLAATYSNGTSGVGATLTNSGSQAALSIDGVTLASAERVLVKDQTATEQNGIYQVTTVGNGSTNWVLTRTTDADTASEFSSGVFFFVEKGSSNADNGYVMTQDTAINFGTTAIIFSQFSGAGQITAGDGLAKSSNTLSVNTSTGITITNDNVVIDTTWTGQTAITTVGTIGTGTWNATAISATKGGTGLDTSSSTGVGIVTSGTWTTPAQLTVGFGGTGASTFTSNGILYGNAAGAIQSSLAGANGEFLYSNAGTPAWTNVVDGGTF